MVERILLVDDDLDILRLVGLMLQRQGYEIRAANSGPQALAMVERENPDLILLNVMMPEMDGLNVPIIHKQPDSLTARQIGTLAGQLVMHLR
jgi:pilus assembly protein CpaE